MAKSFNLVVNFQAGVTKSLELLLDQLIANGSIRSMVINSRRLELTEYLVRRYQTGQNLIRMAVQMNPNDQSLEILLDQVHRKLGIEFDDSVYFLINWDGSKFAHLTFELVTKFIQEFQSSKKRTGRLVYQMASDQLLMVNQVSGELIDQGVAENYQVESDCLLYNFSQQGGRQSGCHYMISDRLVGEAGQVRTGQVVLVTGALGGIGTGVCRKYQREGWEVIGIDLAEKVGLEMVEVIDHYFPVDLSSGVDQLSLCLELILKQVGRLDLVVHVAAKQYCGELRRMAEEDWDQVMAVNLKSQYLINNLVLEKLRENRGNIVTIGSVHGVCSSDKIAGYAVSKSALIGLVRNSAIEFAKYGIRVNGIAPGAIDTQMLRSGLGRRGRSEQEQMKVLASRHLLGRVGQVEEIAELVWFLGDDRKSGFITGQMMVADGGASLVLSTELG